MGQLAALGVGGPSAAAAIAPDGVAGLEIWLKADSLALADGANVTTWTDSSGTSHNATGATGQTYETGEINSLPIVRFDGTDDRLSISLTNNDASRTMFIVAKLGAGNATGDGLWGWNTNAGFDVTAGGNVRYRFNSAAASVTIGSPGNGVAFLSAARWNSASSLDLFFGAGAATNIDPHDDYQAGATTTIALAARNTGGTTPGQADIGEFIMYSGALSTPDYEGVRSHLMTKWGL